MKFSDWYQLKLFIEHASGISMDALHILAGLGVLFLAAALLRRSIADARPLLVLLVLTLCNEAYDLEIERWPDLGRQLGEGIKDLLLTMALPLVVAAVARFRPNLIVRPGRSGDL